MDAVSAASEAKLGLGMAGMMHNNTGLLGLSGGGAAGESFSISEFLLTVFSTIEGHPYGYVGFIVFLAFWTTIAAPVTPVEIGGGCVFGPVWGTIGSLIGKTTGCCFALVLGRLFGRNWTMPAAIEPYLEQIRKRPFMVMSAIRLAPIPLGVKNYGLSLVRFPKDEYPYHIYALSCLAIGAPFSIMWGNVGGGFKSVAEALKR
mmetsp:Transcript_67900/g.110127  ORF Transcript_67900/g.110127 Transcript_67900/m.110127 type:complete len:203 (-) Transcript_67900:492-1100(-)